MKHTGLGVESRPPDREDVGSILSRARLSRDLHKPHCINTGPEPREQPLSLKTLSCKNLYHKRRKINKSPSRPISDQDNEINTLPRITFCYINSATDWPMKTLWDLLCICKYNIVCLINTNFFHFICSINSKTCLSFYQ